jgi:serine-type D-Ala-D-Ala carboxypeptidase (penicillin-binding protein 5/6)
VPRPPKRVLVRRWIAFSASVLVIVAVATYLPLTLLTPLPTVQARQTAYIVPQTTAAKLSLPSYGSSAIAAVGYPGLLTQGGSSRPLPIASITKIITALVVLQKKPLAVGEAGPNILFTAQDEVYLHSYAARDGDVYPIKVGGTMTEHDVLEVALVASANNYIRALADWAYGSEAKFLPVANAWLKAHGMSSTVLTDATGLNPQNTSTPTDLIALGRLALADPIISKIVGIKQANLPVVGLIQNTNKLLGTVGIDGIKTGTLNSAGASLLFSSTYDVDGTNIRLIGVILDGPSHPVIDAQIGKLVKQAQAAFTDVRLVSEGQKIGSYTTAWGAHADILAGASRSIVVLGGTPVSEHTVTNTIVTGKKGAIVGTTTFTVGSTKVTIPLKLATTIVDPGPVWRLTHPGVLL